MNESLRTLFLNLTASRKWMFTLVVIVAASALFGCGVLTKDDWLTLVRWIGSSLLIATGVEKVGSPTDGLVVHGAEDKKS